MDPTSGAVSNTATGTWLLTQHLWIEDGITLEVSYFFRFYVWLEIRGQALGKLDIPFAANNSPLDGV